jgi:hypothetical protein
MIRDIVTERVIESQKQLMACLLCNAETTGRGVHISKTLLKTKKTRVAIYAICNTCTSSIDSETAIIIERKLISKYN